MLYDAGRFGSPTAAVRSISAVLWSRGITHLDAIVLSHGDILPGGENCRIEVLHPPERGVLGSDNANSIVLSVEHLGHRIILPGDLDPPGTDDVLAEEPLDCDVLQAPHHGSRRSNPTGMAEWCTPDWVVISGSHRWDPGPIKEAYEAVDSRVLHTADSGAVSVTIDPAGVRVESFLRP